MVKWLMLTMFALTGLWGCGSPTLHTAFYSPICIEPYKAYHYHVCTDIHFKIENKNYVIPKGFETDLASIPRFMWPIIAPANSSFIKPAIVHDWFYRKTCDYNRKQTDLIFYHLLRNEGVSWAQASAMYYAVRLFGWPFYNEDYCE